MNEYETDPRRPPANAEAEPSTHAAELPHAERGQSDSTASVPATEPPAADAQAGVTRDAAPYPAMPWTAAQPAPAAEPQSPWQQPGASPESQAAHAGPVAHAAPAGPVAHAGGYAGSAHQPTWPANPGYAGQSYPQGGFVPPEQRQPGGAPPLWAQAPALATPPAKKSRLGRLLAAGAAALVLMTGSGIAGGAVALALTDNGSTVAPRTFTAAPIINSADLPAIAAKVENSVVSITTSDAEGSGVILSVDGYILTNNHVVASATANTVKVVFADGKTATATIVGTDPKTDLAVIKAEGVSDLSAATFGDSDAMQVGDTVLALGSPLGLEGSVTSGIVSALDRTIQTSDEQQQQDSPFQRQQQTAVTSISGLLQTDAPINPGNSGGALVNTRGEVIGINTAIATSGQSTGNIGVGFAIPSNKAKAVANALQKGEKVSHPSLGITVGTAENGGATVGSVKAGGPAAQAGLQQGDVITAFGGKTINDSNDLIAAVQAGKVGDRVDLTYTRNGTQKTATVTLAETS